MAHRFAGKVGEAHRVFVLSTDTFGRECDDAWQQLSDMSEKDLEAPIKFMMGQTGPFDVLLFFDGRNAKNREVMAKLVKCARHLCEVWIVYAVQKGPGRRVAWGSETRETGWISLALPRTNISVKSRQEDSAAAAWAPSTHHSAWVGVPPARWDTLPTITIKDKQKVFPNNGSASTPPQKVFRADHGVPVYWQEKKPPGFWEDILEMLDAKMVVDLSPGSGAVGRACLRQSIPYVAACGSDAHRTWLGNALDREACELITKEKSPLFETDLSELIKNHFQDVLDQMEAMGRDEDEDEGDADENGDGEEETQRPE